HCLASGSLFRSGLGLSPQSRRRTGFRSALPARRCPELAVGRGERSFSLLSRIAVSGLAGVCLVGVLRSSGRQCALAGFCDSAGPTGEQVDFGAESTVGGKVRFGEHVQEFAGGGLGGEAREKLTFSSVLDDGLAQSAIGLLEGVGASAFAFSECERSNQT